MSFLDDDKSLEHFVVVNTVQSEFKEFIKEIFSHNHEKICFNMRDVLKLGLKFKSYCDIIDVSSIYGCENLFETVNKNLIEDDFTEYIEKKKNFQSHIKACKAVNVNFNNHSILDLIPSSTITSLYRLRNEMVKRLWEKSDDIEWFKDSGYNRARVLYEIEQNGIMTNTEHDDLNLSAASAAWLRHLIDRTNKDGFAYVKFVPQKSKTGRVQIAKGSLKCMNIPKNSIRKSIVSRFDCGKIVTLDFNAADYRCIVAGVNDPVLNSLYDDCNDFHSRTVEIMFGENGLTDLRRKILKDVTYMYLYGGSKKVLSSSTGLSEKKINDIISHMDFMKPIYKFKEDLYRASKENGYITTPDGFTVKLDGTEHEGKVLALYGQTCTNDAFMNGLVNVHDYLKDKKSVELFTVHDELVIDMHPDELCHLNDVSDMMELGSAKLFGTRLKVKHKMGPNYWELK